MELFITTIALTALALVGQLSDALQGKDSVEGSQD
jgi:hypothetical protein